LISVEYLSERGMRILFKDSHAFLVYEDGTQECIGVHDGILYAANKQFLSKDDLLCKHTCDADPQSICNAAVLHMTDTELWHRRLAHINYRDVKRFSNHPNVRGINITDRSNNIEHQCEV
jgi:hypothetical protein